MKITQEQINDIVFDLVPKIYQPRGPGALVTDILVAEPTSVMRWAKSLGPSEDISNVQAICINWGKLYKICRLDNWKKSLHSHCIFVRNDLTLGMIEAAFAILHEVGHVDWNYRRKEMLHLGEDKEELHADVFAFEILEARFGEVALGFLSTFGSKDGFNNERYRNNV